jgi:hypothetical protein
MTILLAQSDQAQPLVRALWPLLLLTGLGVIGVILLVLARRSYRRHRKHVDRTPPSSSPPLDDAWAESAKRIGPDISDQNERIS